MNDAEVGDRIELVQMGPDPCPIPPGEQGTITNITGGTFSQVWVDWDGDYTLMLIPGIDVWKKI